MPTTRTDSRDRWSVRERLRAWLGVGFVVAQVCICLVQLSKPRPARFGWQMYSGMGGAVQYHVVDANGRDHGIDLQHYVAFPRYELDGEEQAVTPLVCRDYPGAKGMRFEYVDRPSLFMPCDRSARRSP